MERKSDEELGESSDNRVKVFTEKGAAEYLRTLKSKVTSSLCCVTRKRTEITSLMNNDTNLHLVKKALEEYVELFGVYQKNVESYCTHIEDESIHHDENLKYEYKESSFIQFRMNVQEWVTKTENELCDEIDRMSRKTTGSCVSQASKKSSVSVERIKNKARLAELRAERSLMEKKREIERQKLALEEQKSSLQMDVEIAKAQAIEEVLAEAEEAEFQDVVKKQGISVSDVQKDNVNNCYSVNGSNLMINNDNNNVTQSSDSCTCIDTHNNVAMYGLCSNVNSHPISVAKECTGTSKVQNAVGNILLDNNIVDIRQISNASSIPVSQITSVTNQQSTCNGIPVSNVGIVNNLPYVNENVQTVSKEPQNGIINYTGNSRLVSPNLTLNVNDSHTNPHPVDSFHSAVSNSSSHLTTSGLNVSAPTFQRNIIDNSLPELQQQIRDITTAITLPMMQVPKFKGDPREFHSFMLAFDTRISPRTNSDMDRLYYLQQHLEGEPRELIEGCLYQDPCEGYAEARKLIYHEYGDPHKVSTAFLNTALNWKPIVSDDSTTLRQFSFFLIKCQNAMKQVSNLNIMNHLPNLQTLIGKLPSYLQNKWREHASKLRNETNTYPKFSDVVNFVKIAAEAANDPVFGKEALNQANSRIPNYTRKNPPNQRFGTSSFVAAIQSSPDRLKYDSKDRKYGYKCFNCEQYHDIETCPRYKKMNIDDRRKLLKENKLCFGCLKIGHTSKGCRNKRTCNICQGKHPTSLHIDGFRATKENSDYNKSCNVNDKFNKQNEQKASTEALATVTGNITILQAVLPVKVCVEGGNKSVTTYAFYDQGSTGCFLLEDLKEKLNVSAKDTELQMKTMHGQTIIKTSAVDNILVSDLQNENIIKLPRTYTRPEIPVGHDQILKPGMLKQWPHLKAVSDNIAEYQPDLEIGLLIGSNCPEAMEPIDVIHMKDGSPFGVRYRHGWTISGPLRVQIGPGRTIMNCNRVSLQEVENMKEIVTPADAIKALESDFLHCQVGYPGECGPSKEDVLFLDKVRSNIKMIDGHYVIPLPFRNDEVRLPNNKGQAIKRALYQKKKMIQNETYKNDYTEFVTNVINKGYAVKVPQESINTEPGKVWYLPHHGVYHPRKPDKIRVVFDCSSKYNGISLNDCLIPGPDLTNSLVGVLTRFREHEIAFCGDIEAMFHQVHVTKEDYNYLRFLWWPGGDLNAPLEEYCMKVHLFGAVSSPSIANFALKQIAVDYETEFEKITTNVIKDNFYVDDCLYSMPNEQRAIEILHELKNVCLKGGFKLAKFTSNSLQVIESVQHEELSKELKLTELGCDKLPVERTLGVEWSANEDSFGFDILLPEKPMTRRGLLSLVSTIFDPLGFVAPFVLAGKKLLQELCACGLDWDEEVPNEYQKRFQLWIQDVSLLKNLKIPRCLKPKDFSDVKSCELHIFADASTVGYGSVAYARLNDGEKIHTSFLIGKARLMPVKAVTIPRLELTAAVVATHLGEMMKKEMNISIDGIYYYTDSTTVIHYLRNSTKRFPIFVSNRVKQILDFTTPYQWRYINTSINPADIASRGIDGNNMKDLDTWIHGPDFLKREECKWPKELLQTNQACLDDIAHSYAVQTDITNKKLPVTQLIEYFSSWTKLRKTVAVYLKVKEILKNRITNKEASQKKLDYHLCVEDLDKAEEAIIMYEQSQNFKSEIEFMKREDKSVPKTKYKQFFQLNPFMDKQLIKVGGRLSKAAIPDETKHPILLPRRSHVTTLLVRYMHELLGHCGRNHIIAALREKYWIIAINSTVRSVLHKCVPCRKIHRPCETQKMADLPADRLQPTPPFTHTGLDIFGPLHVKNGRKDCKRYGVIFTCLVSRAVHLEPVTSLDMDSFLNALRRFIARRGPIKEIRCDNGSNFKGAAKELTKNFNLNHNLIKSEMLKYEINWKFNPPFASHMGGVWERLIRSIRKVLSCLLHDHGTRVDDEGLHTVLCEVENIINSRPLTTMSDDIDDYQPITPNHILTLKRTPLPPPGKFQREDIYARKRWRRVQYLADLFWTRWKREYLVTLQQRQKWIFPRRNIKVGDIVLIKDETMPRSKWNLARVTETEIDKIGLVRIVKVQTKTSELRRPISKIVLLIPNDDK